MNELPPAQAAGRTVTPSEDQFSSEAIHQTSVQMLNRMADALERRNAQTRERLTGLPEIKPR